MVASLVPRDGVALVAANGVYGERIAAMLAAQGKPHEVVASGWLQPIDLDLVAEALRRRTYAAVLAVHHETTTGRLNALAELGIICRGACVRCCWTR